MVLKEEQYRALCEVCDSVLRESYMTRECVAIPWLHVIRGHPILLMKYEDLFKPSRISRLIFNRLFRRIYTKAVWFRQVVRSLLSDGQRWVGPKELPSNVDVLFVSHLLNPSQAGQPDDFYFGGLPNELVARGQSVLILLINHTNQPASSFADKWKGSSVPRAILSVSLRFREEVSLHRQMKKESLRLRTIAKREAPGLGRSVLVRASEEALSSGSLTTIRIAEQVAALVAKLRTKTIIVTYEGHAYEKIIFAAARSVQPHVQCIGYQHSALFRLQHAIQRNLTQEYNPDHILTAGTVSKEQLGHAKDLEGIPISVLGSHRSLKGAYPSADNLMHPDQSDHSVNPACLVLPEGIASECHLLFEFSLACARIFPDVQFIWRLHPLVTFQSLAKQNSKLRKLPGNILISHATLQKDIARCNWALY